jgi:hypothetical protein
LGTIFKTRNAADVVRSEVASEFYPEIPGRHELQFELLVDRSVMTGSFRKSSAGPALEFAFADTADVRADHKAEQMLGVDAFRVRARRDQR